MQKVVGGSFPTARMAQPDGATKKRQSYTIDQKIALVQEYRKCGLSVAAFAAQKGIHRIQLTRYLNEESSMSADQRAGLGGHAKKRKLEFPKTDHAMHLWFTWIKQTGAALTDNILLLKAKQFASKLGEAEFTGSGGWLQAFKDRHAGIRSVLLAGEIRSADLDAVARDLPSLQRRLTSYANANRYNADETALFWRCMPSRTLAAAKADAEGVKRSKERITIVVISNAAGTYLAYYVVGKAKRPQCFRSQACRMRVPFSLKFFTPLLTWCKGGNPANYRSTKKAWMTSDLFVELLQDLDVRFHLLSACVLALLIVLQKSLPGEKKLMLVDNAPSHPIDGLVGKLKRTEVVFLPKNTTAVLQPNDQGTSFLPVHDAQPDSSRHHPCYQGRVSAHPADEVDRVDRGGLGQLPAAQGEGAPEPRRADGQEAHSGRCPGVPGPCVRARPHTSEYRATLLGEGQVDSSSRGCRPRHPSSSAAATSQQLRALGPRAGCH